MFKSANEIIDLVGPDYIERHSSLDLDFFSINMGGINKLASLSGLSKIKAMIICLKYDLWPSRFMRNRGVVSAKDQAKLLSSSVAIIGCGGLGGYASTLLARAGIGKISLCDGDCFSESNLNRQILSNESNLGENKAKVAKEQLELIASHLELKIYPYNFNDENSDKILDKIDLVVDCLDSISTRRKLGEIASIKDIPIVYSAIAGGEAFCSVVYPGDGKMQKIYPNEKISSENQNAEKELGTHSLTPAGASVIQSALSLKVLLKNKENNAQFYHFDTLAPFLNIFEI